MRIEIIVLCSVLLQAKFSQSISVGASTSPPTSTRTVARSTYDDTRVCEKYKSGQYCDRWLIQNQTVFVDRHYPQEAVSKYVNLTMSFARKGNPVCRQLLDQALCRFVFPNCTTNGFSFEVAQLCAGSCEQLAPCTTDILQIATDVAAAIPTFFKDFRASHINFLYLQYSCQAGESQGPFTPILPTPGPGISCLVLADDFPTLSDVDYVRTCEGTGNNSRCSFPFTYNGIQYNECTMVNSLDHWRPWCVTERAGVGEEDKWGYCDCDEMETAASVNATCEIYSAGPVCEPYLNGSVVFVDNQYTQAYLGNLLNQFNRSFHESSVDHECGVLSLQLLCHLLFPACLRSVSSVNDSIPVLLCRNTCKALMNSKCGYQFRANIGKVTSYFQSHKLNPVHFYTGDSICRRLPHKVANITESCTEVQFEANFINSPPTTEGGSESPSFPTSSNNNNTIIMAVIVPIVSLAVVLVALCLWRRKTVKGFWFPEEGERTVFSELVWDDDVARAIPESLIDEKRVTLKEQIGEGNFGKVYKGLLDGKTTVAAKSLKSGSQDFLDRQASNSFIREALRMKDLDHPNVMKLIGICWGKKTLCNESVQQIVCGPLIVLPYIEMGDLRGYLRGKRRLTAKSMESLDDDVESKETLSPVPVDLLLKFGYQISKGMDYISQRGIVHRDLAARNCMLTWDMKVKVSDFGLARVLEEGKDYYRMGHNFALPVRWMALESMVDFLFTTESDIWSYGVTLWEVFSFCMMPYAGLSNQEVMSYVQRGQRLQKPDGCPDDLYEVMRCCWMAESNARPTFPEVTSAIEKHLGDGISYLEMQN